MNMYEYGNLQVLEVYNYNPITLVKTEVVQIKNDITIVAELKFGLLKSCFI